MLMTLEKCAYRTLAELYEWNNLNQPYFIIDLGCEGCCGDRNCKVTLDYLIREHELYKSDYDLS
jgi:hypothetical protein